MRRHTALAALLCAAATVGIAQSRAGASLALAGGTIYPAPDGIPVRNGVVLIVDGTIAAVGSRNSVRIPRGTQTIDCTGLTITAGFWNSHVHFMERKWAGAARTPAADLTRQLQAMLTKYGATSVFDTGSMWENTRLLRQRIESGDVAGPRIRSTGEPLFAKGSFRPGDEAAADVLGFMRYAPPEVAGADEATQAAAAHLDAGTDGIKVYAANYFPPFLSLREDAIRAAVKQAHDRGKPAFAHPTTKEGLLTSVMAGVDVIAHTTPEAGPWDDALLQTMRSARVSLIPTLKLFAYESRHEIISGGDRATATAVDQLRAWLAAGGDVLFGTDVGYMSDYAPDDEYALMAEAGMSFRQILASLTTAPARRFGESGRFGRVASGFTADLVVLNQDPSCDIRAFANVGYTIRDGHIIYSGLTPRLNTRATCH